MCYHKSLKYQGDTTGIATPHGTSGLRSATLRDHVTSYCCGADRRLLRVHLLKVDKRSLKQTQGTNRTYTILQKPVTSSWALGAPTCRGSGYFLRGWDRMIRKPGSCLISPPRVVSAVCLSAVSRARRSRCSLRSEKSPPSC